MPFEQLYFPILGGALIGTAATLMLLFNGRVTGISGILASSLGKPSQDGLWRLTFLAGMVLGGYLMYSLRPDLFTNITTRGSTSVVIAGLLVGYGTVMGSGCTSGHGICGISRLSVRSVMATATFMLFGFLTVQLAKLLLGNS
jgi:uncharacterized membrane protein YedE/YeeE